MKALVFVASAIVPAVLALCGVLMRFLSGSLYREEVSTALRTAE